MKNKSDAVSSQEFSETITLLMKQIEERFNVQDNKLQDINRKFSDIDSRFNEVDLRFDKIDKKLDLLIGLADAQAKKIEIFEHESIARDAKVDRIEGWVKNIAKKVKVDLA